MVLLGDLKNIMRNVGIFQIGPFVVILLSFSYYDKKFNLRNFYISDDNFKISQQYQNQIGLFVMTTAICKQWSVTIYNLEPSKLINTNLDVMGALPGGMYLGVELSLKKNHIGLVARE